MTHRNKRYLLLGILCLTRTWSYAKDVAQPLNEACKTCVYAAGESTSQAGDWTTGALRTGLLLIAVVLATAYLWKTFKKKLYLVAGVLLGILLVGSYGYATFWAVQSANTPLTANCPVVKPSTVPSDSFLPAGNEFASASESEFSPSDSATTLSEFAPVSSTPEANNIPSETPGERALLYQILSLFLLTAIIGLTIHIKIVRKLRGLVLLSSVVYLGFVKGACPCMIMSFQTTILWMMGQSSGWVAMLWFVGLLPLTYFFGKIWCGWLCHLGGLQEFLFRANGWNWLSMVRTQKILKYIQIGLLVILVVQLAITKSNIYVHYDPFKVAYNLISANTTGYVLLILLLASSVLVYRPFCRMACPVGLILGWVTLIPGARKLKVNDACNGCRSCTKRCRQHSLHSNESRMVVNTQDCILCGECLGHCKKDALAVLRK